jgi:hypothetical protein
MAARTYLVAVCPSHLRPIAIPAISRASAVSSCAWWLTRAEFHRWATSGNVKLLLPPQQSRGTSLGGLEGAAAIATLANLARTGGGPAPFGVETKFINGTAFAAIRGVRGQTLPSSLGAARPLPPSADICPGRQSVGQAVQFCLVHPVSKERVEHSLVHADGSLLSPCHLRKRLTARDRLCAGNARIEIGRPIREITFVEGPTPMTPRPQRPRILCVAERW